MPHLHLILDDLLVDLQQRAVDLVGFNRERQCDISVQAVDMPRTHYFKSA